MRMYSAVEHLINKFNGNKETREESYNWNKSKENLVKEVENRIKRFHKVEGRHYDIVSYDIIEHDLEKEVYEGEVSHDGMYEDFRVLIGDEEIENILYRKFTGTKVRVTIEVIG